MTTPKMSSMARGLAATVGLLTTLAAGWPVGAHGDGLSFEERIDCARRVERVYQAHRIWPAENPRPRPAFETVLPEPVLRARVADDVARSIALEVLWNAPITAPDLEAEIDRMVRDTRRPAVLQQLFDALDRDPTLIAECLARPRLAERRVRRRFEESAGRSRGDRFDSWWARTRMLLPGPGALTAPAYPYAPTMFAGVDCTADTWETMSGVGAPSARVGHSAVWTGAEMVVWGGEDPTSSETIYLDTGGRYDPATDGWAPVSWGYWTPAPRSRHTAVWTGTEVIVWGGEFFDGQWQQYLDNGARYDPVQDHWSPMWGGPTPPSARSRHSAVWTGTEMIVFGGFWGWHMRDDGSRYDPESDLWHPLTAGPLQPRDRHTAVWTGSEMIVWGGAHPDYVYDDGARYSRTTNRWGLTARDAGTPSERNDHTAVWTGSMLIVWGGFGGLNTGGRYLPQSDSWLATATGSGVPSARTWHTAVWTGSRMVVWGGAGGGVTSTGGSYDPQADTWDATSTTGAPAARYDHTAVFTGTTDHRMIVWGGRGASGDELSSGGIYCTPGCLDVTWYRDADGDGHGDPGISTVDSSCEPPQGYAGLGDDCDDGNRARFPGHAEICDALDNDCDGAVDDGALPPGPARGLAFESGGQALTWPPQTGADAYDVVRGDLDVLVGEGGNYWSSPDLCLADNTTQNRAGDATVPAPLNGLYYLYRAIGCGAQAGTYNDDGPGRQRDRDGDINFAPASCP